MEALEKVLEWVEAHRDGQTVGRLVADARDELRELAETVEEFESAAYMSADIDRFEPRYAVVYVATPEDADGEPIRIGEAVRLMDGSGPYEVMGIGRGYAFVDDGSGLRMVMSATVTHRGAR